MHFPENTTFSMDTQYRTVAAGLW